MKGPVQIVLVSLGLLLPLRGFSQELDIPKVQRVADALQLRHHH